MAHLQIVELKNNSKATLINCSEQYRVGDSLVVENLKSIIHFNNFKEIEDFWNNNEHLGLDDNYVIPQIARTEDGKYKDINNVIILHT